MLLLGIVIKHKGVTEEKMKKKIIYMIMLVAIIACFNGCKKEETVQVAKPIENVDSLLNKYVEESESETETEKKEDETIDYDKIDQDLINQIVANGGSVTDGKDLPNNGAAGEIEYLDRVEYRVNKGFQKIRDEYGLREYENNSTGENLSIECMYVYDDVNSTIESIKAIFVATYGDWTTKSTYKTDNGYVFQTYGNNTRQGVNAAFELFICTKDNYLVALVSVSNKLGSEALRDLADSVIIY